MSGEVGKPLFTFVMKAAPRDPTDYCYVRWDRAYPITVIAANRNEAEEKAAVALGKSSRGWPWVFNITSIDEVVRRHAEPHRKCRWRLDDYGLYETSCGKRDRTGCEFRSAYCDCGGKIVEGDT